MVAHVTLRPQRGQAEIPIDREITVLGRSGRCHLSIADGRISRRHCQLTLLGDQVKLTDLGSLYGTYVNDQPVREVELKDGDRIRIGRVVFVVRIVADDEGDADADAAGQGHDVSAGLAGGEEATGLPGDVQPQAPPGVDLTLPPSRSLDQAPALFLLPPGNIVPAGEQTSLRFDALDFEFSRPLERPPAPPSDAQQPRIEAEMPAQDEMAPASSQADELPEVPDEPPGTADEPAPGSDESAPIADQVPDLEAEALSSPSDDTWNPPAAEDTPDAVDTNEISWALELQDSSAPPPGLSQDDAVACRPAACDPPESSQPQSGALAELIRALQGDTDEQEAQVLDDLATGEVDTTPDETGVPDRMGDSQATEEAAGESIVADDLDAAQDVNPAEEQPDPAKNTGATEDTESVQDQGGAGEMNAAEVASRAKDAGAAEDVGTPAGEIGAEDSVNVLSRAPSALEDLADVSSLPPQDADLAEVLDALASDSESAPALAPPDQTSAPPPQPSMDQAELKEADFEQVDSGPEKTGCEWVEPRPQEAEREPNEPETEAVSLELIQPEPQEAPVAEEETAVAEAAPAADEAALTADKAPVEDETAIAPAAEGDQGPVVAEEKLPVAPGDETSDEAPWQASDETSSDQARPINEQGGLASDQIEQINGQTEPSSDQAESSGDKPGEPEDEAGIATGIDLPQVPDGFEASCESQAQQEPELVSLSPGEQEHQPQAEPEPLPAARPDGRPQDEQESWPQADSEPAFVPQSPAAHETAPAAESSPGPDSVSSASESAREAEPPAENSPVEQGEGSADSEPLREPAGQDSPDDPLGGETPPSIDAEIELGVFAEPEPTFDLGLDNEQDLSQEIRTSEEIAAPGDVTTPQQAVGGNDEIGAESDVLETEIVPEEDELASPPAVPRAFLPEETPPGLGEEVAPGLAEEVSSGLPEKPPPGVGEAEEQESAAPSAPSRGPADVSHVERAVENPVETRPLHEAAREGNRGLAALFITKGAPVDALDDAHGATALHYAAGGGHASVVELLLDRGADANQCDRHGATPLDWAQACAREVVVRLLRSRGG